MKLSEKLHVRTNEVAYIKSHESLNNNHKSFKICYFFSVAIIEFQVFPCFFFCFWFGYLNKKIVKNKEVDQKQSNMILLLTK